MFSRKSALPLLVVIGVLGWAGTAMSQDKIHNYLNDTSLKVKAATSPEQKREILATNLGQLTRAINTVKGAPLTTDQDRVESQPSAGHAAGEERRAHRRQRL
jgi:hypothetical protein